MTNRNKTTNIYPREDFKDSGAIDWGFTREPYQTASDGDGTVQRVDGNEGKGIDRPNRAVWYGYNVRRVIW